jgi:hypothetical protein
VTLCMTVGSRRVLPIQDDFEGDCRVLEPGVGKDNPSRVVDGVLEVSLASDKWVGWVDLREPTDTLTRCKSK